MSYIQEVLYQEYNEGIKRLSEVMNGSGGYLIMELDDQSQRDVLTGMWNCIHDIAFPSTDSNDDHASLFRQQELTHNDGGNQGSQCGYRYIETSIRRHDSALSVAGNDDRDSLETILGGKGASIAAQAFQLLLDIANTIVYMAILGTQIMRGNEITSLKESLQRITDVGAAPNDALSDEDTPWSCTVHRLCRYAIRDNDKSSNKLFENIRSHTDWTLLTLVPVSKIAGLEIWNSLQQAWVRPEVAARRHWESEFGTSSDDNQAWNSRYVVVMAGKWLELLTDGHVQAAVHRVVATKSGGARMSAPFFLRPRSQIATDVQKFFGAESGDVFEVEHGVRSAVERLNCFLRQRYF